MNVTKEGGYELTGLDPSVPVILVLGGSQGAQIINSVVVRALPTILEKFQVIHQTGTKNFDEINKVSSVVLASSPNKSRYKTYAFLDDQSLKMAAGIASLIISRAGSTIFEIAQWGIPSIIIPITETNGNHQRLNAYNYARAGACAVIEEENLSAQVLAIQVEKLITDSPLREQMVSAARKFANPNASKIIAREILRIALQHEK
jgi:UDP-N-acetylglucosamine--N-acetylmuramyl-(pentapeptide) pyrophosphoryl-undecaprenol N-acetylglucosamine transferase